jgi:hypothetical protein
MSHATLFSQSEKLFGVTRIGRKRPFAIDIFSRRDGSLQHGGVFRSRRKHGNEVHVGIVYKLLHFAIGMWNVERSRDLPGFLEASARYGDYLVLRQKSERGDVTVARPIPNSDQSHSDFASSSHI